MVASPSKVWIAGTQFYDEFTPIGVAKSEAGAMWLCRLDLCSHLAGTSRQIKTGEDGVEYIYRGKIRLKRVEDAIRESYSVTKVPFYGTA